MKKLSVLIGVLAVTPFAAHAQICTDFDKDMNIIEYDCSKSLDDVMREHDNKGAVIQHSTRLQKEQDKIKQLSRRADKVTQMLTGVEFFVRGAYGFNLSESFDAEIDSKTDNSIYGAIGMRFNSASDMFYDVELAGAYIPTTLSRQDVFENTYTNWDNGNPYTYKNVDISYINMDIKTYNLMLNAYVGYHIMPKLSVYGGAGVGYVHFTGTEDYGYIHQDSNGASYYDSYSYDAEIKDNVLVRLALGGEYKLNGGFSVFTEYSYMLRWIETKGAGLHNLLVGARYTF